MAAGTGSPLRPPPRDRFITLGNVVESASPSEAVPRPRESTGPRARLRALVEAPAFQRAVTVLIVVNALALGVDTVPALSGPFSEAAAAVDQVALALFTAELGLRLVAHGRRFARDPWSMFDLAVVAIALLPDSGGLSVLRALRVLRVLRLISAVPSMRRVVAALLGAIPGMVSTIGLLVLILYVSGVMATELFAEAAPDHFGDLGASLFTLFQIMTGDGWSDVSREIMKSQPLAWAFFVVYILVTTFAVLNLFIAIVVSAMEEEARLDLENDRGAGAGPEGEADSAAVLAEVRALSARVEALRAEVAGRPGTASR
ncbi:hypothetical protein GCM10009678_07830 [Actinomadura kijaniata]